MRTEVKGPRVSENQFYVFLSIPNADNVEEQSAGKGGKGRGTDFPLHDR